MKKFVIDKAEKSHRMIWIWIKYYLGFKLNCTERGRMARWITRNVKTTIVDEIEDDYMEEWADWMNAPRGKSRPKE